MSMTEATPLLTEEQVLAYVREHGLEVRPRKPIPETVPMGRFSQVVRQKNEALERCIQLEARCAELDARVVELEDLRMIQAKALELARQRIEEAEKR